MYTLLILFYISLLGIIVMLLLKRHEVKTGKRNCVSRLGAGTDHIFQKVFNQTRRCVSYINKRTFIALAHWMAFHVLKNVREIYVELKHRFISTARGKMMIDAVRGRGEVSEHGASFYLRRISNGK